MASAYRQWTIAGGFTSCGLILGYTASETYWDIPRADIGIYRQIGGLCTRRRLDKMRERGGNYKRFLGTVVQFNIGIYCHGGGSKLTS